MVEEYLCTDQRPIISGIEITEKLLLGRSIESCVKGKPLLQCLAHVVMSGGLSWVLEPDMGVMFGFCC